MDLIATANSTVSFIARTINYVKNNVFGYVNDTSMTSITKLTRAEPLTIISNDCSNITYLPEIMDTLCSLYSAHYLQSVNILTKVNDVEVIRILDRLNPDRDSTGFLLEAQHAAESIYNGNLHDYKFSLPTQRVMAMERDSRDNYNYKRINEANNLAVGKLLDVSISVDNEKGENKEVVIPVSVRLSPTYLPVDTINYIFKHRSIDDSWTEKWYAWRAGRISFIKDAIFSQNLIDEYRKAAMQDKSGTLQEIVRRAQNAKSYGVLTKNPSLAVSSNLYVLSKAAAARVENEVGYKFSQASGREKLLKGTYAMVIAIVDEDKEMVDFYFRDVAAPARMSVRSLRHSSKGKDGIDISDVMKSLMEGRTPTF